MLKGLVYVLFCLGNKREYEDEDQKEVITKKKQRILEDKDESNSDFSEHDEVFFYLII